MALQPWETSPGRPIVNATGQIIESDECPCTPTPTPTPTATATATATATPTVTVTATPTSDFPGAGWYCIHQYSTVMPSETCDFVVCQAVCEEIANQTEWDAKQFGVCYDGGFGVKIMNTTDGIPHEDEDACNMAGCECPS